MLYRKMRNVMIFKDTQDRCFKGELLEKIKASVKEQVAILQGDSITVPCPKNVEKANVVVSTKRTLEAAEPYARQGKKVCVLNFASATNPGGGVKNGSSAQEESICRCSTLHPCLDIDECWKVFYEPHRKANDPLYNDDCIYTPSVCVIKSDTDYPEPLESELYWNVNVITCAAPNLREEPSNEMNPHAGDKKADVSETELEKLLTARIRRIFDVAVSFGNEVLILGAFGCGAFKNPPTLVAKVFNTVMQDYLYHLKTIEYAVFCTEREKANYIAFKNSMM
ncbi:MAG: TIGR02452 family protein [Clostridia bacterium]|nr:TIGR02452 family protein [Clostridia bacterium]